MITGTIDQIDARYDCLPEPLRKALTYLKENSFTAMPDGDYPIDGEAVVAHVQRYTARPVTQCRPEAHRKYIDIQFIAAGTELVGWCPLHDALSVAVPYDAERDVMFFDNLEPVSAITLQAGTFAILYPDDVHCPQGAADGEPATVTKVVVKIAVDCL